MTASSRIPPALCLGLALGLLLAIPRAGDAQSWVPRRKEPSRAASSLRDRIAWARARIAVAPLAPAATVPETEPNDSTSMADSVALGDVGTGVIDPAGDVDYYTLNITAGTTVNLDVDANQFGSPLDPVLALVDRNGQTVLAFNDDFDGLDSRIEYTINVTGRYYVGIAGFAGSGCPGCTYSLRFGSLAPAPGDPTTVFASGLGRPWGIAAGPTGEFYVADINSGRILRVSPSGAVTTYAMVRRFAVDVVVDGFGNLLVAAEDSSGSRGFVARITPAGVQSTFVDSLPPVAGITVGPDGDVWVLNPQSPARLLRYDPHGTAKSSIDLSGIGFSGFVVDADLAFSPTGELHFSNAYDGVFKLVNNVPQRVIQASPYLEGLAFDRDGYLYVSNGFLRTVLLFDPSYQVVKDPFARTNLDGPIQLVFARSASGAMTSRLLANNYGYFGSAAAGTMVEMNPAGMRAIGWRVGVDLLLIANDSLRSGLIGFEYADTVRVVNPPGALTWSVAAGSLPPGLTLDASSGAIAGIPQTSGQSTFTVRAQGATRVGLKTFRLTVGRPDVSVSAAAQHLLGASPVSMPLQRFLDLQGNNNGRYDVGDFRAYLRAKGQLPAAAAVGAAVRKEQP